VVKRYVIIGKEEALVKPLRASTSEHLDSDFSIQGNINIKEVIKQAAAQLERRIILKMLDKHRWNRRATARALGISYAALLYKLRQAGIPPRRPGEQRTNGALSVGSVLETPSQDEAVVL